MFRNILNTTVVKFLNAVVSFGVLLINARMLGPHDLGTIGLILLAITIILMLNNLVGGSALVFLVPRFSLERIVKISWLWSVIAALIGILAFVFLKIEPAAYTIDIFLLSLIMGLNFVNQNILIGKGEIRFFNYISFVQYLLLILLIVMFFYVQKDVSIEKYLVALYISWGAMLVLSTVKVLKLTRQHQVSTTDGLMRSLLRLGVFVQIANLTQFLNYRLSYYFVEHYLGRSRLGVFEIGNKLADGVWLFGKSISLVHYSWIANAREGDDTVITTLRLFRLSFLIALSLVLVMIALPENFYLSLFGDKYEGLYIVILCLAPGIVAMSSSMILSHHFAGTGKHHLNTIGSVIGLGAIIVLCLTLVPAYGLPGAAMAASFTYLLSLLYNIILFRYLTGVKWYAYWFKTDDFVFAGKLLKKQWESFGK